MIEDFLNSPWSEALQYALIVVAAVLSPSISAWYRHRERAKDAREERNARITFDRHGFPKQILFTPEVSDEPHFVSVRSLNKGLMIGLPIRSRPDRFNEPQKWTTPSWHREVRDIPMDMLQEIGRGWTGHLGCHLSVAGEPGRIRVEIKWSRRVRATRIITIHNPAKAPLPIQDTPSHQAETDKPSA